MVKFACSALAAQGVAGLWTWHCSSGHAEVASYMPQLGEPTTKNTQLGTGGLWGEEEKKRLAADVSPGANL